MTTLNANQLVHDLFELEAVRNFDCREDRSRPATQWEADVNLWLNAPQNEDGARFRMTAKGGKCKVWIYTIPQGENLALVGYGSLARSKWPDMAAKDWHDDLARTPISLIPSVGIQTPYQGGPPGVQVEEKYSSQILNHLVSQAREKMTERQPILGLYVHTLNARALRLYKRFGFLDIPHFYETPSGDRYRFMALSLRPYTRWKSDG